MSTPVMPLAMARASVLLLPLTSWRNLAASSFLLTCTPELIVSTTASLKSLRPAWAVQASSMAWSSAPFLPARSAAIMRSLSG